MMFQNEENKTAINVRIVILHFTKLLFCYFFIDISSYISYFVFSHFSMFIK